MNHYQTAIYDTAEDKETNALIEQWQASSQTDIYGSLYQVVESLPVFQQSILDIGLNSLQSPLAFYGIVAAGITGMAIFGKKLGLNQTEP